MSGEADSARSNSKQRDQAVRKEKKKTRVRRKQNQHNQALVKRPEIEPTPSLASRSIRPVATAAAPGSSYYLDLADVALGHKPVLPRDKKGRR